MKNEAWLFVLGFWLLCQCAGWGQSFDCSVAPRPGDNFLEARFRFVLAAGDEPIQAILVFIPGTDGDGRSAADNPAIREIAQVCHAAVLGCDFRGEGLSYDDPDGGSGWALDRSLVTLSAQAGHPELSKAPLLLLGFSQGSMLVFNYVCWRPERVKAFAALRAIFPRLEPQEQSFQVPGLLAAGENDEAGRTRSIAGAFLKARGHHAKWALLFERNSGHDAGKSLELAKLLFEAACHGDVPSTPIFLDSRGTTVLETTPRKDDVSYFPNQETADLWRTLHRPTSLEHLLALKDRPCLQDLISVGDSQALFECENGQSREGVIQISSQTPGIAISGTNVSGEGFSIVKAATGGLPSTVQICFAPKSLPWGCAKGLVTLSGRLEGIDAGSARITTTALVKGTVNAVPSMVYLGVVSLGHDADQSVLLMAHRPGVHFAHIQSPDEITVSVEPPDKEGNLPMRVHWSPKSRLGRMEGHIDLTVDAPERGLLRIPVVGFVAPARSVNGAQNWSARAVCWSAADSQENYP